MMFLRYLVAAPLILLSYAVVPFGYLTLSSYLFQRSLPGGHEEFDFAAEFIENFTEFGGFWPVPVAFLLFAGLWWMTAAWPRIALLPSVPVAFGGVVSGLADGWQKTALAAATPFVAWGTRVARGKDRVAADHRRRAALGRRGPHRTAWWWPAPGAVAQAVAGQAASAPARGVAGRGASRSGSTGSATSRQGPCTRRRSGGSATPASSPSRQDRCCGSSAAGRSGCCRSRMSPRCSA
ncbi:hypothetical protein FXN61_40650 [Lentzea sp. PSKA42]|uniref:Uncharacterized protein n=1 Tax=Lentzea indica TaxID=2604800 RepID=A0ABX1FWB1_9PSEU|nr:hypothetical protein [Lentzea indica]